MEGGGEWRKGEGKKRGWKGEGSGGRREVWIGEGRAEGEEGISTCREITDVEMRWRA